ncbi:MAG TPA: hypothetical protein VGN02_13665 [Paenibacillus sp.]
MELTIRKKRAGEGASPVGLAHEMAAREHEELFVKSGFAKFFK